MFRYLPFAIVFLSLQMVHAGETVVARPTVLRVTLAKAIEMALRRNFSIEVERLEPEIARQRVRQTAGRFDPVVGLSAFRSESTVRDVFDGTRHLSQSEVVREDRFGLNVSGATPWGTDYSVGFGSNLGGRSGTGFEDRFQNDLSLDLNQSLLRGGGTTAGLSQLRIARNNVLVSDWALRDRVIDIVTETIRVYNDLHLAHENLRVAIGFRDLARRLVADNQRREQLGAMIPLNVTTARAEAASREEAVIVARRRIKDNENFLKQLITNDLQRMLDLAVEIEPPVQPSFSANVAAGIDEALQLRPDYRQAIIDLENRRINIAFRKNQALPQLDLRTSLNLLGFDNDFGTATSRIANRDRTSWTVGAIFSVPIPNREGQGGVAAAKLTAAQGLINLQRLEQQIIVEVDNASGQILTARQRITATREARELASESLAAGEKRLQADSGTTFEVLELQEKLAEAEFAELRALADYNKAVAEYHRRTGTTLREHRIQVE